MLRTHLFGEELKKYGFDFYSGVPCSYLKNLMNYAVNNCEYVMAANEGDAVAICAGAHIGGRKTVVLMQNSGLTNALSPLTSLNFIFKIPVLGFIGFRGEVNEPDEPQHELLGRITAQLIELMGMKWDYLSDNLSCAKKQIVEANKYIKKNEPFFFIVRKDIFKEEKLKKRRFNKNKKRKIIYPKGKDSLPRRIEVLDVVNKSVGSDTLIFAATGFTSRELYEVADSGNKFYMLGSMGCVSSLALGVSLAIKNKRVVAIDGDGALLMRLGSLATNAYYCRGNMLHILLDNNAHESTGGQTTASCNVDFVSLASSAGYPYCRYVHNLKGLKGAINKWKENRCPTFIYMKIEPGTKDNLGRPRMTPVEVKERIMQFIPR